MLGISSAKKYEIRCSFVATKERGYDPSVLWWWDLLAGQRSNMTQSRTCNCITFLKQNNERHYCRNSTSTITLQIHTDWYADAIGCSVKYHYSGCHAINMDVWRRNAVLPFHLALSFICAHVHNKDKTRWKGLKVCRYMTRLWKFL